MAAAAWTLRSTLFGRQVLAVGGNERAARLSGVPVAAVKRSVYAISGLCAGIAGLVVVSINSSSDGNLVELGMELDAIAAVAVGGTPFTGGQATVVGTAHRRAFDSTRALHPARERRARRRGAGGQGRDHRGRRLVTAAGQVRVSAATANPAPSSRRISLAWATRQRVMTALILLILFGALRYDHFLGVYNVLGVLRYNSMFALTSLGMCFVIMGAGIDLSVGTTAAFASVVSALMSPYGLFPGLFGGLAAGLAVGVINGFVVTRMNIQPFIATLSGMLAASGSGLLLAQNQSASVSYDTNFTWLGQGDLLGFPVPAWIAAAAYVYGSMVLNYLSFGRYVLSVGGNEEAARLMGLPVDRVKFLTYVQSGVFAGLAGATLAAQLGAGQPAEGVGWELFSIAAVAGRRDADHGRRGLGRDDARRRTLARPHL